MLPVRLLTRFQPLLQIWRAADGSRGVDRVFDSSDAAVKVIKWSMAGATVSRDVLAWLSAADPGGANLLVPMESGFLGLVSYELSCALPGEILNLRQVVQAGLWADSRDAVVRGLVLSLARLHSPVDGRYAIHGDVKPGNILLGRRADGDWSVWLSDFDCSCLVNTTSPNAALDRYTPAYAAPEVIGRASPGPAADWWSLGMTLLEAELGRHPLDGLTDAAVRSLLVGDWKPSVDRVRAVEWRSLLGALLQRDAALRWAQADVRRWLDKDPLALAQGLSLAGESASSTPFLVAGLPVHSARELVEVALVNWQELQ